ncbi:hypothetical protein [Demequina sp. NBRC 110054]|uniref:hypothetical protein n=1 Tax=Demequina sp. NBRC 110054 TaxID=1570343 RepID=UPI0011787FD1|nr:hypothetical protein [Demequina sp. NBRC 110054]
MRLAPCAPVLARPDGRTQVGTAAPLLLEELSAEARPLVIAAESASLGADGCALLGEAGVRLTDAGLLIEEAAPPEGIVAIHGAGRIGLELGAALAATGVAVAFADRRPVHDEPDLFPRRALVSTCAGGAAWAVRERFPHAAVVDPSDPTLAVQISLGGTPRHTTTRWEHDGLPHLLISVDEAGATVGPLVVPGETACGRCLALERTEADPAWPILLEQLAGRRPRPVPEVVPDIVAAAARLIVRALRGGGPSNEAWRLDIGQAPHLAEVVPRPDCGCGAAGTGTGTGTGTAK